MKNDKTKASEEQLIYARLLGKTALTGLGLLIITFTVYASGILPNVVDFDKLQNLWKLKVSDYLKYANTPTGWEWVRLLNHGDVLNYIGISVLSGATVLCYFSLIPVFIRKKDTTYLVITIIEIVILSLAASNILTAGGH